MLAHLVANRKRLGIARVLRGRACVVDGALLLDDGRYVVIEIKYRMGWLKACQAGWQLSQFAGSRLGRQYRPRAGIVFFEEFSADWARLRGAVESGWLQGCDYHATDPGHPKIPIHLVRFQRGRFQPVATMIGEALGGVRDNGAIKRSRPVRR